jgi:tRNA (cmo5U34)-methyltransferase
MKSTVEQIRARFDNDVERFSNLDTGQTATVDAPLIMELVARTAAAVTPHAHSVLDVGCGAGNYTLRLLQELPNFDATLVDLSGPMLARAEERVSAETTGKVITIQGDIREVDTGENTHDICLAAMTLHHLRSDAEWESVFSKLYRSLRAGGALWIADMIEHSTPAVQALMWQRYGEYLSGFKGEEYRDHVWAYVEQEDTPRPLLWQIELLTRVGFSDVELLHKNSCFAAFGGIKR